MKMDDLTSDVCHVCGDLMPQEVPAFNDPSFWQCSHALCPNRHTLTAAPTDMAPAPLDDQ